VIFKLKMSSKVITLPPKDDQNKSDDADQQQQQENQDDDDDQQHPPGVQRNFYRTVSGAGDGHALQTTAEFSPKSPAQVVKPHLEETIEGELNVTLGASKDSQTASSNDIHIDVDWQKKIRSLQDQVNQIQNPVNITCACR
jgi:hypothetical protein